MSLNDWMDGVNTIFNVDSSWHLVGVTMLVMVLFVVFVISRRKKKTRKIRLLDKALEQLKLDQVDSVVIPDGIGGILEIERLILMDQGLLILETYPITGHLFGAERIDQWTQIVNGRSYKFPNPLRHIHNSKHALQTLAPKVPIHCLVVFTGQGDFPKGKPNGVSVVSSLDDDLQAIMEAAKMPELSKKAWQRILRIARKNGSNLMKEAI
ncbi:nuclease-related domain-containing protein [Methylophaga sp.]|uniref:nuclease-related domain-containing protein n=1 Tax=Methylophaga sp. TaxID=2024840 RepID=UPI003F69B092